MSVSRRGFLQGLGVGRTSHASAFIAARGHEEYVAEAMQQGRQAACSASASPAWSGSHSHQQQRKPARSRQGRDRRDPRQVPRGQPLSVQQHAARRGPRDPHRQAEHRQARERRARRRLAGAAEERGARVHVADQAPGRFRRRPTAIPPGFAQNVLKYTVKSAPVDREDAEDRSGRAAAARQGRRPGLHLQPEQPDRRRSTARRRSRTSSPR